MSSGGGGTNTVQTQSGPPQDFLNAYNNVFGQAQQVAATPSAQYPGQTVAGLSPDQSAGITGVENAYGMAAPYINSAAQYINNSTTPLAPGVQPYVDSATGLYSDASSLVGNASSIYGGLTQGLTPQQIQQYQSPYTSDVVNATEAQLNNQNAIQQNQLAGNAGTAGAYGGDRQGVAQAVLAGQQQLNEAPTIANLENQGYMTGLNTAEQQQGVQAGAAQGLIGAGAGLGNAGAGILGASGQLLGANEANSWLNSQAGAGMANLGNAAQTSALTGSNALLGVGGLEQQQAQSELNVPYEQYLAQQAYPFQSTGWLANIAEGLGGASGGNSSTTSPGPSALSQIGGAGIAGAGILGQTGAFGQNGWLTGGGGAGAGAGTLSDAGLGAESAAAASGVIPAGVDAGLMTVARGGMIPRRAPGGSLVSDAPPFGSVAPVSSGSPYGMSLPDAQISIVPGSSSQMGNVSGHPGSNLLKTSTGSTSTTTGGGNGDSTFGDILKAAGGIAAGIYGGPAGALAANALSSQVHFARGGGMQPVNDNWSGGWSEPKRAAGGSTQVTIVPGSYAGSPGVPQISMAPPNLTPGGNGMAPAAAGPQGFAAASSNPTVQAYLAGTLGGASFAPPPHFTPPPAAAAPPPTGLAATDPALANALNGFLNNGNFGGDGGGGNRDGGRLAHRADGGTYGDSSPLDDPDMHGMAPPVPGTTDDPWDMSATAPSGMGSPGPRSIGAAPNGPPPPPSPVGAGMQGPAAIGAGTKLPAAPADTSSSPWKMLTDVGLGIMGGTSPFPGVNVGRGALQGLKQVDSEKQADAATAYRQQALSETGRHNLVDEQTAAAQLSDRATKTLADIKARDAQLGLQGATLDETKREHDIQAQGNYTWQPGTQTDPSDPNKSVTGSWRYSSKGDEPPKFFPGVNQTAKPEAGVAGFGNISAAGTAHGDDYLKTLDPKIADQVKAIGDGRMAFPSGFALKTPYWQNMLSAVAQYDPSFDAVNYNARAATRKDFTSGQAAKNVSSLNTVMGHLAAVKDAGDALQNGSTPLVNTAVNWIKTQTGNANVNNFQTAADAVADELEKSFRGSAGAVTGIRNWRDRLSSSASPEQQAGAWKTLTELLDSRIDAMGDQYSRGMGKTTDGLTLLAPHAQEAYQHLTGRAPNIPTFSETGQKSQAQPGAGQPAAAPAWKYSATGGKGFKAFSNDGKTWFNSDGSPIAGGP